MMPASNENVAEMPPAWESPKPIPSMLLPVQAFDVALLPESLRGWVSDIADRMQCPPDFPAVGAMVALSSVIGRRTCIAPKRHDDWLVFPNLWGGVVGRPGVMKSPALSESLRPLDRLQAAASDAHEDELREFEVDTRLEKIKSKSAEAAAQKAMNKGKVLEAEQLLRSAVEAEELRPPPLRRYRVNDSSVEALGEILMENPFGVLAYRDELHGLLRSLDKDGQEGARAFYLQGYDGNQSYTFDRIMRGRNLHIEAVCIAMLGGIQPGRLQSYIRDAVHGGAGDDGLLQRFGLLVWPDVTGEWHNVDRWPDTAAKQRAFDVFLHVDAMAPASDPETGALIPSILRFDAAAQDEFDQWRVDFERALRAGDLHPAVESHLAKYRKLVPALALVCGMADGEHIIGQTTLLRALSWAEYLRTHAERIYAAGTGPSTDSATALLKRIRTGKVTDGFSARDVYLAGWAHLNSPELVHSATEMLCDLGYLRRIDIKPGTAGGRPSAMFQINPAVLAEVSP
ncbi:MAG: DUF3987 domain-containing protein [Chromatiaceae bacterium]|nr:DUF3987 domain-containing protein [Chromatiaceae bacterium]MCP5435170.1 DUF3987 domain-containing protein [Chromatiaceae bacterium]